MTLAEDWADIEEKLIQRPDLSDDAIHVARMMFYYGAGLMLEKGFKNPDALQALATELHECDLAQAGRKLSERHKQ